MSREWIVLWLGRRRRDPWEELCADYLQRTQRHHSIRDLVLKPSDHQDPKTRLAREAEAIRAALPEKCRVIALDRRGRGISTLQLASKLQEVENSWPYGLAFVIGSDLGLDAGLLKEAQFRLSLSAMTFPHALARVAVYEQLYRVATLRAGIQYHREPVR